MRNPHARIVVCVGALGLLIGGTSFGARAEQNPLAAARDALRKAQESVKNAQEEQKREAGARRSGPATAPPDSPGLATAAGTPPASQAITLDDLEPTTSVPVRALPWKTMPDLVGVHLHMTLEAAQAVLKPQYARHRIHISTVPPIEMPTMQTAVPSGLRLDPPDAYGDQINLSTTVHPNDSMVWRMRRIALRQHVNRATLLSALRKKYGKETAAYGPAGYAVRAPDDQITHAYWLFDQQGRPGALPASGVQALAQCQQVADQLSAGQMPGDVLQSSFDPWCASSYIAIYAEMLRGDEPDIVEMIRFEAVDVPLALAAARATVAWRDSVRDKLRQDDIQRSKGATPKL